MPPQVFVQPFVERPDPIDTGGDIAAKTQGLLIQMKIHITISAAFFFPKVNEETAYLASQKVISADFAVFAGEDGRGNPAADDRRDMEITFIICARGSVRVIHIGDQLFEYVPVIP